MGTSLGVDQRPRGLDGGGPARLRSRSTGAFWPALAAIAAAGAVWRFAYTYASRDTAVLSDGLHYSHGARFLADGQGFINPLATMLSGSPVPDAVHPPGWTSLLAVASLAGRDTDLDFQVVAATVGVTTIVVTGLAARAAFDDRVGLIAAGLTAAYPNIWLYERELVSEPSALLAVATVLWCTYRFRARPSVGWAVGLGAAVAMCALTRAELVLLAAFIVVPTVLLARPSTWGRRIGLLVVAGATSLVFIGPWFAYNTTRFTKPVPLSAGIGAAMTAGNCESTYDPSSEVFAYYHFGCAIFSGNVSDEPSEADVQLRQNAMHFIGEHKGGFVVVATARLGRAFSFYAPLQQVELEGERGTTSGVIAAGMISYWLLLPFAVVGTVVARRRRVPIYPFVALVVVVVLAVVPTIGSVRYRAPAEIPLVVLAAVGIDALFRSPTGRRSSAPPGTAPPATGADPHPSPSARAVPARPPTSAIVPLFGRLPSAVIA